MYSKFTPCKSGGVDSTVFHKSSASPSEEPTNKRMRNNAVKKMFLFLFGS